MTERPINDIDVTMKTSLHLPQAQKLVRAGYGEIGRAIMAWFAGLKAPTPLRPRRTTP